MTEDRHKMVATGQSLWSVVATIASPDGPWWPLVRTVTDHGIKEQEEEKL